MSANDHYKIPRGTVLGEPVKSLDDLDYFKAIKNQKDLPDRTRISFRELSAKSFLKMTVLAPPGSVNFALFVGVSNDYVYIERYDGGLNLLFPRLFKRTLYVYATRIDGLPDDIAAKLRNGENPFKLVFNPREHQIKSESSFI